jgi:GNAT superfamily N-acetyltransferase
MAEDHTLTSRHPPRYYWRMHLVLRPANRREIPSLEALIERSARDLSRGYYSPEEIAAAIEHVFGVDTELIEDGTYLVAEVDGGLAGCGGWSRRRTLFGSDRAASRESGMLDPATEPAKIRAFFVHPDWARRGIGQAILGQCEAEARRAGFRACELMATLPGVPFYRVMGYEGDVPIRYDAGGVTLQFVPMRKALTP